MWLYGKMSIQAWGTTGGKVLRGTPDFCMLETPQRPVRLEHSKKGRDKEVRWRSRQSQVP